LDSVASTLPDLLFLTVFQVIYYNVNDSGYLKTELYFVKWINVTVVGSYGCFR